ncbi:DUF4129 domain-containing protein [Halobaculum magnesiiphilum]|uniref:DUF4129 domain-containing protein n=1 Tax=Halobaculum magnesiiphilum TaxID=1017351 RepID=A0A8T8WAC2_9EURY|nr:DUF4129 domain-containing protein [Halobaculum magnesiiphilum]QZP36785.1 DUF4129 domain-containing protein [Halobaculum magnesiiphilum]
MTRTRVVPVLIAVVAIAALGVTATSLESTLTTDPDEEINPDWDRLPIGEGDAASIKQEIADGDGEREADRAAADADGEGAEDMGEGDDTIEESSAGDGPAESSNAAADQSNAEPDDGDAGLDSATAPVAGEVSLLDRLLALLATVLRLLWPLVALLAVGAICYRYRGKLLGLFGGGSGAGSTSESASEVEAWPGATPSNVVDRAWVTLVQRVNPDRPETITTAECARLARERNLDTGAVESIATAFERVHYGGASVAEEEDRAREGLRRLAGSDGADGENG